MKCKFCEYENDDKETICQYCGSYLKFPATYKHIIFGVILIILCKFLSVIQEFIFLIFSVLIGIYAVVASMRETAKIRKIRKEHNIDIKQLIEAYLARTEQEEIAQNTDNVSNEK